MRACLAALLATLLVFAAPAPFADGAGESEDPQELSSQTPSASDVIAGLYQFDLFQQNASAGTDSQGSDEVKNVAIAHADAATELDRKLKAIQEKVGSKANLTKSMWGRAGMVIDAQATDGPEFDRKFYQAQVVQYKSAVS